MSLQCSIYNLIQKLLLQHYYENRVKSYVVDI